MTKFEIIAGSVAPLLLSGCVAISGVGSFETADDALPASGGDISGGDGQTGASGPAKVASDKDGGPNALAPPTRPLAGVYTYDVLGGSGDELKGNFPIKNPYGATAKIAIEHEGATCFNLVITLRDGYDETLHLCIVGSDVVEDKGIRAQKFPLVGTVTTYLTCAPGDAYFSTTLGTGWKRDHTCTGGNSDSKSGASQFVTAGPYRYVGQEGITVKGTLMAVSRFRDERQVTGSQTGTNVADWYFAPDGTLVKFVRATSINYASFIGNVNYVENVTLTLSQLPP